MLMAGTSTACLFAADTELSALDRKIPGFTLTDYRGKTVSLSDFKDREIVVVAFTGTECPLAKLYGPRLQSLQEKYRDRNVEFIAINSNRQDTLTEIAAWARRYDITFPVLKDRGSTAADLFGAVRTPEVYVLDAERKIRYQGRIDDQYGIGIVRDKVGKTWLADAVDALLAGKSPEVTSVESVGCHIGRVKTPNPDSPVTYSNQIARIFRDHCVECHRAGEIGPFTLTSYDEVVGWAEMIREVVNDKRMPPWHADRTHGKFANDRSLTDEQIAQIDLWVRNGAPEGDPAELPEPKTYIEGWQLPRKPDVVVSMRDKPFHVSAEGEIKYQYFKVDPGFTEDKYVSAAEIIPGNRSVVHHILVFAKPPGKRSMFGAGGGEFLVGYVPGSRFKPLPRGMAKLVPKGSELVFQVHYTPIGTEQEDLSKVGLIFSTPEEVTDIVVTQNAINTKFKIEPHESDQEVKARSAAAPADLKLLNLMPHMHLRGKSFSYTLVKPDNSREPLLNIPAYDFNWQTAYRLAEPKTIPRGGYIECVAHYDNSENNLANPDPEKTVKWGDQTDDEMMIGYFDIVVDKKKIVPKEETSKLGATPKNRVQQRVTSAIFEQLDKDKDGFITEAELTDENQKRRFVQFDVDGNQKLTEQELEAGMKRVRKNRN
jgi:peroxiredoxin/mono/diheme cytochrome c family protein